MNGELLNGYDLSNLTEEEKQAVLTILQEMSENGTSELLDELKYADYKEIPVDIMTFIKDDNYLGKAWHLADGTFKLFPYWENVLKELFPDNVSTSVNNFIESGARGLGKSEIAVTCALYMMYRLMCMKNPHLFYNLKPTEKFCFAFVNITEDLAYDIGVNKFQKTVQASPWFMARGKITGRSRLVWNPPDYINIIIGSQSRHVIGLPILYCFADEISFRANKSIEMQKADAIDLIDTALGGMKTRFTNKGKNYGLLVLASSKRSEKSFLETHVKKKLETEPDNLILVDEPVWNVRPASEYSGIRFKVAQGNKFVASEVIPEGADEQVYIDKGCKIIEVPIEYKPKFLEEIDRALCDYAGVSSSDLTKFIAGSRWLAVKTNTLQNPFNKEVIEVGNAKDDKIQYYDYFDMSKVDKRNLNKPLYIHLDMSLTGDRTGIGGVWAVGKKASESDSDNKDMYYQAAFHVAIQAPRGYQVSMEKNRKFIRWLKKQGFKIAGVSSDTFQSADLQQQLTAEGFSCSIISVDRVNTSHVCEPYQYFRNTIYEERFTVYDDCELLTTEVLDLEKDSNGKIDHPKGSSKDISDGLCLHPDTSVFLLSGKSKTIKELYESDNFNNEYVLSYNTITNTIEPVQIQGVINNGYKDNLVKLTLDTGESITCTDDHLILCRDGSYKEAKCLLGESLMPFSYGSRIMYSDRDYTYINIPQKDKTNKQAYLHKIVAEYMYTDIKDYKKRHLKNGEWVVIHHKDCNRKNNNPDNLIYLTNIEHSVEHCKLNSTTQKRLQLSEFNKTRLAKGQHPFQLMSKEEREELGRRNIIKLNKSEEHRRAISENNKRLAAQGLLSFQMYKANAHTAEANAKRKATCIEKYGGESSFASEAIQGKCRNTCLKKYGYTNPFCSKEKQHEMQISKVKKAWVRVCNFYNVSIEETMSLYDYKIACYALNIAASSKESDIREAQIPIDFSNYDNHAYTQIRNKGTCVRLFLKENNTKEFTYEQFVTWHEIRCAQDPRFKHRFNAKPTYSEILALGFNLCNHKVVKIEAVEGSEVYDIQLDRIHNFALTCGIFVHNCGAMWNASLHIEEFTFEYGESINTLINVNSQNASQLADSLVADLEKDILNAFNPVKSNATNMSFEVEPKKTFNPVFGNDILYW